MPRLLVTLLVCLLACPLEVPAQPSRPITVDTTTPLQRLSARFWRWRVVQQPVNHDDIPRIDRPSGWAPDWSPPAVAAMRDSLTRFQQLWREVDTARFTVPQHVDYRLVGSAIARVAWELDGTREWQRNPRFYIQQTLGAVYDRLLPPPPFSAERSRAVVTRFERIPATLDHARANLTDPLAPFAELAIAELRQIRAQLDVVARDLTPLLAAADRPRALRAIRAATTALEGYRDWLQQRLPGMAHDVAVGPERYRRFLNEVALVPYGPDELVRMARQEWDRAVMFESFEANRNRALPRLPIAPSQTAQIATEARDERAVRTFLTTHGLLTVPDWMQHYVNLPLPSYIEALRFLGVTDDLTSEQRLDENGVSYIPVPSPLLGYFYASIARDPRPIIVHEGVPGHYFQLALSSAHPNPIRRRYYDSGPNEGIGFYAEEMMLQAGLFDDRPRVREIIYNFMRLRALRVEVDVKLATGQFSIAQAAGYLARTVPMDSATALEEAASFASGPGQAITYQIGKLQITEMLSQARVRDGVRFDLRAFHDYVWLNGNVPFALQRWELLGDRSWVDALTGGVMQSTGTVHRTGARP
ncbi:MAG: DUF885 domain-containing protein [Gemmatimonadaceae bacterium]|jgi:hypothetical protein|nr:DUF885 domain-containing protein [Gemmatimonadaceae bacterium]